jgi:hypothetical protein
MAAVANIVIADGQAAPVNHTFNPVDVTPDLVKYADKVTGIIAGFPTIQLGKRLPSSTNGNYKSTGKIMIPSLETAATAASGFTPGPTVAYYLQGDVSTIIPERATLQERKDLYAYMKNCIALALFSGIVVDMDFPY